MTFVRNFFANDRGVTLVEYGIAIGLAIIVGAGAITTLAGDINTAISVSGAQMPD